MPCSTLPTTFYWLLKITCAQSLYCCTLAQPMTQSDWGNGLGYLIQLWYGFSSYVSNKRLCLCEQLCLFIFFCWVWCASGVGFGTFLFSLYMLPLGTLFIDMMSPFIVMQMIRRCTCPLEPQTLGCRVQLTTAFCDVKKNDVKNIS